MKSFALTMVILGLGVSCSHWKEAPVTVQFPYAAELLEKVQRSHSRAPASLSVHDVEQMSPRRVYFSALYHQYLTLGRHLDRRPGLAFCPQFHHDKIQTDSSLIPQVSLYQLNNV